MLAITGGGLAVQRLWHGDPLLGLLGIALAAAGALIGLIVAFGAVSGGHFNPLITGLQWLAGERSLRCTLAYALAQCLGAVAGAVVARLAFGGGAGASALLAVNATLVMSEAVATAGLMLIVFGCSRSTRRDTGPFAVGVWLASAIIATPSASYANPAISLGALFAAGPVALAPATALAYVAAEILGALAAFAVIAVIYPQVKPEAIGTGPAAMPIEKNTP